MVAQPLPNWLVAAVLKSALSSSGVFEKNTYGLWFYKEKEAMDYIIKINEKILTKKLEKEKNLVFLARAQLV